MASPSLDRRLGLTGNKAYKAPCDVATTTNITLSGEQTIDGVVTSGSRVLVWSQTNAVDNGIWDSSTGSWSRAIDCNTNQDLAKGTQVYVSGGITYAGYRFVFTSSNPIQPGTSSITITQSTDSSTLQARLADPTSASNGDAMLAVLQPFSGAVALTQHDVNQSWVTSQQFRQSGDPDDTLSVQRAMASGRPVRLYGSLIVTTVQVTSVHGIYVDAGRAQITSDRASAFYFEGCNDLLWTGGRITVGDSLTGISSGDRWPFFVKNCSNARVACLKVTCTLTYAFAPITFWNVAGGTVAFCQTEHGGDNSIWCFFGSDLNIVGNTIIANERGRAITMQQVNGFTVLGNTVKDGKGDGISIHGSANGSVTGNTIYNMANDAAILATARGISIETDENANTTTIAAAEADPYLYNGVYARNIAISGNNISNTISGIAFGSTTIAAGSRGNYGIVTIGVNEITNCTEGLSVGVARGVRVKGLIVRDVFNGGVLISFTPDTGGKTVEDLVIDSCELWNCNRGALGYTPFHVTGTWDDAKNVVATRNNYDDPGFSNSSSIGKRSAWNTRVTTAANGSLVSVMAPVESQAPIGDQARNGIYSGLSTTGEVRTFTISGQLTDSFTNVVAMPSNGSLVADVQIGTLDRVCQVGTIACHNGTTPAFSFTGIGAGFAQVSGGALQLKGNTSAGAANYGGVYTLHVRLMKAG